MRQYTNSVSLHDAALSTYQGYLVRISIHKIAPP